MKSSNSISMPSLLSILFWASLVLASNSLSSSVWMLVDFFRMIESFSLKIMNCVPGSVPARMLLGITIWPFELRVVVAIFMVRRVLLGI